MKIYWRYLEGKTKTVKHAFYTNRSIFALCGFCKLGIWKSEIEGLEIRRVCKRCKKMLE